MFHANNNGHLPPTLHHIDILKITQFNYKPKISMRPPSLPLTSVARFLRPPSPLPLKSPTPPSAPPLTGRRTRLTLPSPISPQAPPTPSLTLPLPLPTLTPPTPSRPPSPLYNKHRRRPRCRCRHCRYRPDTGNALAAANRMPLTTHVTAPPLPPTMNVTSPHLLSSTPTPSPP